MRALLIVLLLVLPAVKAMADDRLVLLSAPPALVETGLFRHVLPRFSLKTQIRVEVVESPSEADIVFGEAGVPVFEGAGQVWFMDLRNSESVSVGRFSEWLGSDVGKRTITGFAPDGTALFKLATEAAPKVVKLDLDGDAALGKRVSLEKCTRCHAVDDATRMAGIGSTPSFAVLRSLADWQDRFSSFFALKPHPAFTIVEDVTPPFPANRPSPIAPVELSLEEVEAVVAYVGAMEAADLGAPLTHQ